jgi:hypothetical protein
LNGHGFPTSEIMSNVHCHLKHQHIHNQVYQSMKLTVYSTVRISSGGPPKMPMIKSGGGDTELQTYNMTEKVFHRQNYSSLIIIFLNCYITFYFSKVGSSKHFCCDQEALRSLGNRDILNIYSSDWLKSV